MDPKTIADRQIKEQKAVADKLAAQRHAESLAKIDALATSNLQIMRSFVGYLNKRTSKTEVTNQLDSIATPDALKVVEIIKKLDKTVKDKTIDWAPMQEALKPIADILQQQLDKEDPEAIEIPEIDYQKITDSFGAAIAKLAAPVVNVAAPVVKIPKPDAPIINTEKVDLAPFVNEVLQVLTDFRVWTQDQLPEPIDLAQVEELLTKNNELLTKLSKKNFGGSGGGGGGYVFKAFGPLGGMVAPELANDGSLPVTVVAGAGAGTQYADGVARGTATGTLGMIDDGVNIQSRLGDAAGRAYVGAESVIKKTILANAVGDTTVYTPTSGKAIRLNFFGYSAGSGLSGNLVQLKLAGYNGGAVFDSQYLVAAGQPYARNLQGGKKYVQGSVDGILAVTLSTAQSVYVNFEIEEI